MTILRVESDPACEPVPLESLTDFESFRAWTQTGEVPETGRIDYLRDMVSLDFVAEEMNVHGRLKAAVAHGLMALIDDRGRGSTFIDRMRVAHTGAKISVEPDVLVVLHESEAAGRIRPEANDRGEQLELVGTPDLVVECVSRTSVKKDTTLLRHHYHQAGIPEYWLADARAGAELVDLQLLTLASDGYTEAPPDADGYRPSRILEQHVRIRRLPTRGTIARYVLETRE